MDVLEEWEVIAGQRRYFRGTHPVDEKEVDPQKIGQSKSKRTCIEGV
jgi:hypothetical protein